MVRKTDVDVEGLDRELRGLYLVAESEFRQGIVGAGPVLSSVMVVLGVDSLRLRL